MPAKKIMVQGTASHVGKSVVTAALCRYFREQGCRVAPFKSQNMSNNSFVTASGGEIGRSQAFQAQVCEIEPTVEMNPILLKPATESGAQVVVLGKAVAVMDSPRYHQYQPQLIGVIQESLARLEAQFDVIVIEGAGSPAEINLRPFDIVNMRTAMLARAPVVLVGDINLGGVFASLLGTLMLLADDERDLVKGLVINKFRGNLAYLQDGLVQLEARTAKKVLGVLPWVRNLGAPEEDSVEETKQRRTATGDHKLLIQVIHSPRISNFTDFEPLEAEADVELNYLGRTPGLDARLPDLLILPGTKSTIADLLAIRAAGLADYIRRCRDAGVTIVGVCGGYQMLGKSVHDPLGVESQSAVVEGLGLLNVRTTFEPEKVTHQVRAVSLATNEEVTGYEIHMGRTAAVGPLRAVFRVTERLGKPANDLDGAASEDGRVWGTYIHGLFDAPGFRRQTLDLLRRRRGWPPLETGNPSQLPSTFASLSALVRDHMNLSMLMKILDDGA